MVTAIAFTRFGGPEELRPIDVPDGHTPPGFVKIRVHAASVNPVDTAFRAGGFGPLPTLRPPYIPGVEAAGVIIEDRSSAGLKPGTEVMAATLPLSPFGGAYSEEVIVPGGSVSTAPRGLSLAEAATLPINGSMAHAALDHLSLRPGQMVAVTGAVGVVGGYVVQLAKSRGLFVIADAAEKDEAAVRALGADAVVRRGSDVAYRIREHAPSGVDGLVDGAVQGAAVVAAAVKDHGALASVRPDFYSERGIESTYIALGALPWERLRADAEAGILRPRIADVLPARRAPEAHRRYEAGGVRGRIVLTFER